ncbi:hypothetical protein [Psychromonas hadalis]|uniref:hypothetical protein n=1 Tax=Psychromonas hadalis TaxID=211669 RepID=UPI0003B3FD99|nr:hypothetical protein [Psychromonas hadalis]
MFDALYCYKDNSVKFFSVFEFKNLSDAHIEKYRYHLTCPACGGKAYFRRDSIDGKQACFGSRYHKVDCAEFAPSPRKTEEQKQVAEVETLILEVDELLIDFSAPIVRESSKKSAPPSEVQAPKESVKKESKVSVNKQTLKKLLVSLLRGSSLASSDLWIYTSEKHKWRAKNLFVNVNDAKPTDNGAPRMYWGTIATIDKTLNWLNPAEERSVAIPIGRYRDLFLSYFKVQEQCDVEGAGFIMFAKCIESKDKKRKFLQLWGDDLQYFHLSKAQDDSV